VSYFHKFFKLIFETFINQVSEPDERTAGRIRPANRSLESPALAYQAYHIKLSLVRRRRILLCSLLGDSFNTSKYF
jgi:hypothetical protein